MLRRFFKYYLPYKGLFALDMITAALLSGFTLSIPFFVRNVLKEDLPAGDLDRIIFGLGAIFVLVVLMCAARYVNTRWGHFLGTRMEADMRSDLFCHLQKLSYTYFDNAKTGHLMSRIGNDLFNVAELAHHGPEDFLISTCMIIGSVVIMFAFSPAADGGVGSVLWRTNAPRMAPNSAAHRRH